jgi:hypothetical protein
MPALNPGARFLRALIFWVKKAVAMPDGAPADCPKRPTSGPLWFGFRVRAFLRREKLNFSKPDKKR